MFNSLYICFFSTYNKGKYTKRIAILHSIARGSLGKLRNNLCLSWRFSWSESVRQNLDAKFFGKALEFPGKRLQKSLPECCFALDTDFDWLRQKNKPRMAIFPIENIAHEHCNVLSHCKNCISQLSRRFLTLYVNNEFECFIRGSKHEKTVETRARSASVLLFSSVWSPDETRETSCLHNISNENISLAVQFIKRNKNIDCCVLT